MSGGTVTTSDQVDRDGVRIRRWACRAYRQVTATELVSGVTSGAGVHGDAEEDLDDLQETALEQLGAKIERLKGMGH